jgi:hypothetical protein
MKIGHVIPINFLFLWSINPHYRYFGMLAKCIPKSGWTNEDILYYSI